MTEFSFIYFRTLDSFFFCLIRGTSINGAMNRFVYAEYEIAYVVKVLWLLFQSNVKFWKRMDIIARSLLR